ncbi:MAG TPA: hypothetical protein VFO19_07390 [Vicinamibacterales bacterium]|nr:hypothetical protein [Vicinamibacterales bacterium]
MAESSEPIAPDPAADTFEHPRGTLAIVILFAVLFALGWLGMYFHFVAIGAPTS